AEAYVRPHDLDVHAGRNGKPYWNAPVDRITPLGGILRLDLQIDADHPLPIELPCGQSVEVGRNRGDGGYVTPRHLNVYDRDHGVFQPVDVNRALNEAWQAGAGI